MSALEPREPHASGAGAEKDPARRVPLKTARPAASPRRPRAMSRASADLSRGGVPARAAVTRGSIRRSGSAPEAGASESLNWRREREPWTQSPLGSALGHPEPGRSYRVDVRERADPGAHVIGDRVVEREDHQRLTARMEAADLHRGDVHVVLAEERAHPPDEAGLVLMLCEEQVTFDGHVDPVPID